MLANYCSLPALARIAQGLCETNNDLATYKTKIEIFHSQNFKNPRKNFQFSVLCFLPDCDILN